MCGASVAAKNKINEFRVSCALVSNVEREHGGVGGTSVWPLIQNAILFENRVIQHRLTIISS